MVNEIYVCLDCELQVGQSELEATLHGKPKCYQCNAEMTTVVAILKLMSSSIDDLVESLESAKLAVGAVGRQFTEIRDKLDMQPTKRRKKVGAR